MSVIELLKAYMQCSYVRTCIITITMSDFVKQSFRVVQEHLLQRFSSYNNKEINAQFKSASEVCTTCMYRKLMLCFARRRKTEYMYREGGRKKTGGREHLFVD